MFTEQEIDLLNSAYQTFVGRSHTFDVLSKAKWSNMGIENWVQTEFVVALVDRDYGVTTIGKVSRDCDLIVSEEESGLDVGIEIKAFTRPYLKGLISGIEGHPKADLYFFICRFDEGMQNKLEAHLKGHSYIWKNRIFNGWMVMLVKKE